MTGAHLSVLITGAKIVDGTGNPWFYGDVGLLGDRVAAIAPPGSIQREQAEEQVDVRGLVVSPGFIDIQSHSIVPLMVDGRCLSKITQGVTTEVMGEKWTPAPAGGRTEEDNSLDFMRVYEEVRPWIERSRSWSRFGDWLEAMIEHGVSPNVGSYLGGGTLRAWVKGMDEGPASSLELEKMRDLTREAMRDGAFGVAYALIYPPDAFVGIDELVGVCEVVGQYGGTYITHMRSEADGFLEALEETLEIGRRSSVDVEIYHLKVAGRANWPKMAKAIERINAARAQGQDVTADMYPYLAGGTGLSSIFPPALDADGKLYENLCNPALREQIRSDVLNPSGDWEPLGTHAGPEGVYPIEFLKSENKQYIGKNLAEIAAMRDQDWIDAAIDLLADEEQRIGTMYFMMSEDNLRVQLQQPWIKISTDAGGYDPVWAEKHGPSHPRAYGTYPRVLGKYVREEGVLTLEDAVRKMSSAVATRLGIRDRGLLRERYLADVILFDPATIGDCATYEDSHQISLGVRDVWINGERVLRDGEHTGATPGRIVRGPGYGR